VKQKLSVFNKNNKMNERWRAKKVNEGHV